MTRLYPLALLIASAAVVGGALLFQFVGGLQPCELCLYQRWPYYCVLGLCFLALVIGDTNVSRWVLSLAGLLFVASAALAFYHVGVEQHWFAGPTSCTGPALSGGSVADLKAQLLATKPVRCDDIAWSLFGISLAGWNFVASLLLLIFSFGALNRLRRAR